MSLHTLESSVALCRAIEPHLANIGYHCGLTGSCLFKGQSDKDSDIIIYAQKLAEQKPLTQIYEALGLGGITVVYEIPPESRTDKNVVRAKHGDNRIDLFFL